MAKKDNSVSNADSKEWSTKKKAVVGTIISVLFVIGLIFGIWYYLRPKGRTLPVDSNISFSIAADPEGKDERYALYFSTDKIYNSTCYSLLANTKVLEDQKKITADLTGVFEEDSRECLEAQTQARLLEKINLSDGEYELEIKKGSNTDKYKMNITHDNKKITAELIGKSLFSQSNNLKPGQKENNSATTP